MMGPMMAEMLDLSDDQVSQIKAIHETARDEAQPLREQMQTLRTELQALWNTDTPDREAILAKMGAMDGVRAQLRTHRVDTRLKAHAVLTPEQRAKAAELHERFAKRRGKRGKGFGQRPGCFDDDSSGS